MSILIPDDIHKLLAAVTSADLSNSRGALLVGIPHELVVSLATETKPRDQILRDLDTLNTVNALADGSVPILRWLMNAAELAGPRSEAAIFKGFLGQHTTVARLRASSGAAAHAKVLLGASELVTQETAKLVAHHRDDHPLLRCFAGWLGQVADQIHHQPTRLEVDAHYYQGCLSKLQGVADLNVRAIADLSDTTEMFWLDADPLNTTASERIFLVNWKVMFENNRLDKLLGFLRKQSERYPVKVHHMRPSSADDPHVFGREGFSRNLLLIKPDLVGGYVKRERDMSRDALGRPGEDRSPIFLRIQSDERVYREAVVQYARISERALTFDPKWDRATLRQAWMVKNRIGRWDADWGDVKDRSGDYFERYDLHIRCWIPEYERFVAHCVKLVEVEITRILRSTQGSIRVLEIGCGTGALTVQLVEWIRNMNRPFLDLRVPPPIEHFIAVDRSPRMVALTRVALGDVNKDRIHVCEDTAPVFFSQDVEQHHPFHVICGSLVLHDLLDADPPRSADDLLKKLSAELAIGGCLVLADSFFSGSPKEREKQLRAWKQAMATSGMQRNQIEEFLDHNNEMIETISLDDLQQIAPRHGFSAPRVLRMPGDSPFGVLVMMKSGAT
jgi:SAM-dependent methyltransferase